MGRRVDIGRLKILREEHRLTQGFLAEKAGVSKRTIERLEQGWSGNVSTIKKIAAVLDVQAEELLLPGQDDDEPGDELDREPFADYFAAIKEVFGNVRFLGLAHRVDERNMPIEKMFVEPELCDRYIDPNLPLAQWPKRQGLLEALAKNRRMVVLGDPGSGKSTIVSMIACMLADKRKNPWRQALDDAIPVPLILRELALPAKYSFDELLESLQQTELGRCLSQKDMRLVIDAVKEGRAILLLDGIDELSDVARREALHKAVWEGTSKYQRCRLVMTSRITGHDAVPFHLGPDARAASNRREERAAKRAEPTTPTPREFRDGVQVIKLGIAFYAEVTEPALPLLYVVPFDDTRIELFALNWYRQREESERRAKEKANALTEAVRRDAGTTTLARIPNLLTLMALVHRLEADLPHGKARLYAKIVETYLETIDNYRKLTERPDSLLDKKRWLARVAFAMQKRRSPKVEPEFTVGPAKKLLPTVEQASELAPHGQARRLAPQEEPQREILIERKDLQDLIADGMKRSGKKHEPADVAAFIDHIQRRSGLLIERGADLFAFTHLSFQEYFAAWYMSRLVPKTSEFDELKQFVDAAAWLETFCHFFEIVADEQQERKEEIRRELLGTRWESGEALLDKEVRKVILLARLACDPYSGLDENSSKAVDSSLRWELQHQQEYRGLREPSEALRILVSGNPVGGDLFDRLFQMAQEKKITKLSLRNAPITDLNPIAALTNLYILHLQGTSVIDLTPLAGLANLQWLDLQQTSVSNLEPLAELAKLQTLDLQGTLVKDLKPLAGLANLKELRLGNTLVTDLKPLARLANLHELRLRNTLVTDLNPLKELATLQRLFLQGTSVTIGEVASLKAALPNLEIQGP